MNRLLATSRKKQFYQNSGYEEHQFGPQNAGSLNFSFQALKGEAVVGVTQMYAKRCVPDRLFSA
jgi:hypothetical protein